LEGAFFRELGLSGMSWPVILLHGEWYIVGVRKNFGVVARRSSKRSLWDAARLAAQPVPSCVRQDLMTKGCTLTRHAVCIPARAFIAALDAETSKLWMESLEGLALGPQPQDAGGCEKPFELSAVHSQSRALRSSAKSQCRVKNSSVVATENSQPSASPVLPIVETHNLSQPSLQHPQQSCVESHPIHQHPPHPLALSSVRKRLGVTPGMTPRRRFRRDSCYTCLVLMQTCELESAKTRHQHSSKCKLCYAIDAPRACCSYLTDWQFKLSRRNSSDDLCHVCRSGVRESDGSTCIVCGMAVCSSVACEKKARVVSHAPVFICCHCLGIPYACQCPESERRFLELILTVRLPVTPPEDALALTWDNGGEAPFVCHDGHEGESWLLQHAAAPCVTMDEHSQLLRDIQRLRKLDTSGGVDIKAEVAKWLQSQTRWSSVAVAKYLHFLERELLKRLGQKK